MISQLSDNSVLVGSCYKEISVLHCMDINIWIRKRMCMTHSVNAQCVCITYRRENPMLNIHAVLAFQCCANIRILKLWQKYDDHWLIGMTYLCVYCSMTSLRGSYFDTVAKKSKFILSICYIELLLFHELTLSIMFLVSVSIPWSVHIWHKKYIIPSVWSQEGRAYVLTRIW